MQSVFEGVKGYSKKLQEVKDHYSVALQTRLILARCVALFSVFFKFLYVKSFCVINFTSLAVHRDRRRFLRTTMRELCLFIKDQVGLLGPKILFVWMALCFARDEVVWLLRHATIWPVSSGKKSKHADDVVDR